MAHTTADIAAVQARLQELLETMPPAQAEVLEAVVAGTPVAVDADGGAGPGSGVEERGIIIVSGRSRRWFVFDLGDVLAELNPQPLPPEPPDRLRAH